jgi:hypothetical protein
LKRLLDVRGRNESTSGPTACWLDDDDDDDDNCNVMHTDSLILMNVKSDGRKDRQQVYKCSSFELSSRTRMELQFHPDPARKLSIKPV